MKLLSFESFHETKTGSDSYRVRCPVGGRRAWFVLGCSMDQLSSQNRSQRPFDASSCFCDHNVKFETTAPPGDKVDNLEGSFFWKWVIELMRVCVCVCERE